MKLSRPTPRTGFVKIIRTPPRRRAKCVSIEASSPPDGFLKRSIGELGENITTIVRASVITARLRIRLRDRSTKYKEATSKPKKAPREDESKRAKNVIAKQPRQNHRCQRALDRCANMSVT